MLPEYTLSIDQRFADDDEELGIFEIANTDSPAATCQIKGIAFSTHVKKIYFKDDLKYRIAAPVLSPGKVYRNDKDTGEESYYKVTPEFIEDVFFKFQATRQGKKVFNEEHDTDKKPPSFILETWMVTNPKKDKSFTEYGIECPKNTWFAVQQFTDKEVYHDYVKRGLTGFSIHGRTAVNTEFAVQTGRQYADIIVKNSEGKYLMLLRREDDKIEGGKYGFPGGGIEDGETPQEGGLRELMEETGIQVDNVTPITSTNNEDGTVSHYFGAESDGEVTLSDEHTDFSWMTEDEIKEANVIFGNNARYIELIKKVNYKAMDKQIFELEGKKYYADENGVLVEVTAETEMAEDTKTEEDTKETEMATEVEKAAEVESKVEEAVKEEEKVEETEMAEETKDETKTEDVEAMEDEKKEDVKDAEMAEEPLTEAYTRAEIDAKFDELYEVIAKLKGEAVENEEEMGTEMSKANTEMSTDVPWYRKKMQKVEAMKDAKNIMTKNTKQVN